MSNNYVRPEENESIVLSSGATSIVKNEPTPEPVPEPSPKKHAPEKTQEN